MPGKDDPLDSARPRMVLWLDREGMEESRDNYWHAYLAALATDDGPTATLRSPTKMEWDVAYAAAVAAFDFLMSGRLRPG